MSTSRSLQRFAAVAGITLAVTATGVAALSAGSEPARPAAGGPNGTTTQTAAPTSPTREPTTPTPATTTTPSPTVTPAPTTPEAGSASEAEARTVRVWFTAGEQFHPEERTIPSSAPSVVDATIDRLLDGPTDAEEADDIDTQIPVGVTLRSLEVDDDLVASVRMSPGLLKGVPADPEDRSAEQAATLKARLGQITYTVTQFRHIKRARVYAGDQELAGFDRSDYDRPTGAPPAAHVNPGTTGSGVAEVQQALANRGYLPSGAVDGKAGDRTRQAVLAFQGWEGLARDGIAGPDTRARLKTAHRPSARGDGRRIEVYRSKGVALVVDEGRTVRALHVSTGKPGYATPAGSFKVFRKERQSWSVPFSVWLPYASYFNRGIAFHEYDPVPAYPASHGCVRVAAPDARWLYDFASVDTRVDVI